MKALCFSLPFNCEQSEANVFIRREKRYNMEEGLRYPPILKMDVQKTHCKGVLKR